MMHAAALDQAQPPGPPRLDSTLRPRRWLALPLTFLLVAAVVTAAHAPALKVQALSFDDDAFVTHNPLVGHPSWTSVGRFFSEVLDPSTVPGYYLPLAMTSLMLDVAQGGRATDLTAFHRTALALHVITVLLILLLLYRLFGALVPAALVALAYGLHPLTVEPIAWVGERKTLLATLFTIASLLAHLRVVRGGRRRWWAVALGCYVLALLSKPTVTMLPVLLLILDAWPLRRLGWPAVREKWPYFLVSLVSGIITLISHERSAVIGHSTVQDYLAWPVRAGFLLAFYLGKLVRPVNLTSVYPDPWPFTLANPVVVLGLAVTLGFTALLLWRWRAGRDPAPLAGWLFFVVAILPTLSLLKYSWVIASDKYVYFPVLGFLLVLAAGLSVLWRRGRPAQAAVLALGVLALAAEARGTRAALRPWSDTLTLFHHMEHLAPDSPWVLNELGIQLMTQRNQPDQAAARLTRAVRLAPGFGQAWYNLGMVRAVQGRNEDAVRCFRAAIPLMPDDADAVYYLGFALRLSGRNEEATQVFERAVRIAPRSIRGYAQIGSVLAMRGRPGEACVQFRQALTISPEDPDLHFELGSALVLAGRPAEAAGELRLANRFRRDWPEALNALAWLLATHPDPAVHAADEALRLAVRASSLTHESDAEILDTVAAAQAAAGRFPDAIATAERAVNVATRARAFGMARLVESRLALYRRGVAYQEVPGPVSLPPVGDRAPAPPPARPAS
jgi:protein O-mannosyl-transferase